MRKQKRFMYKCDDGRILYFDTICQMREHLQAMIQAQPYFTYARGGGKESVIYDKLKELITPMVRLEVRKELEIELKKLVDCLG